METQRREGIAARAGRWSARHRVIAIVGWLVFLFIANNVGGSVSTKHLTTSETHDGESAAANRTLERGGFARPAAEQVLVQVHPGGKVLAPAGRSAITEVVSAVSATGRVTDVRSPLTAGNGGQVSRDGRSAVVLFSMKGKADTADKRVEPVVRAVGHVAAAHPGVRVEEFGSASATKSLNDTIGKDFSHAEGISIPLISRPSPKNVWLPGSVTSNPSR